MTAMLRPVKYIVLLMVLFALTGCLNPGSERAQNHVAYESDLSAVQRAVDAFKKDTGVLPIKNSTEKTPIYEKYPIDFDKLVGKYMGNPPENAYEQGGIFLYVLVNAETDPTVKVLDLTLANKVDEIQEKINLFRMQHGFSPIKAIVDDGVFSINFRQIGYKKPPTVRSPYSGRPLGFVLDKNSKVYINYLPDIYDAVKKLDKTPPEGTDLRALLVKRSPYVPVDSLPYTLKKGEVVFMAK